MYALRFALWTLAAILTTPTLFAGGPKFVAGVPISTLQLSDNRCTPPVIAPLTPTLSIAAGATVNWTTQAIALSNGAPVPGQILAWQATSNIKPIGTPASTSNSSGIASKALSVGPPL